MPWPLTLLLIVGSFLVLMLTGMPLAFCFMLVNIVGVFLFWGSAGLGQLILSIYESVTIFPLICLPMFVLMGEVMFESGTAPLMLDAIDRWLGRMPGRLSLVGIMAGTVFATFTGNSMASAAVLGEVLVPEMEKRGYKKSMSLGPILGSCGLAPLIPPSSLAVFVGVIAEISIGKILIGVIVPGLVMATVFSIYIIVRCYLQPVVAPPYRLPPTSLAEKLVPMAKYVLPLGFVIFFVMGFILLGLATPSEAAASGALSCFILAAAYGRLNWQMTKRVMRRASELTVMVLMIIAAAIAYSQVLAFSGATQSLCNLFASLPVAPIFIFIGMQFVVFLLGMFMHTSAIILITLPIFMPVIQTLGLDEIWFAIVFLINIELAGITPPYGLLLFVMKSVGPPGTTIGEVYRAALPFVGLQLATMGLLIVFPGLVQWLPGLMS